MKTELGKYLFWLASVLSLFICLADSFGLSHEIYGEYVLPFFVRLPMLVVTLFVILIAWINGYPNGNVQDLFKAKKPRQEQPE